MNMKESYWDDHAKALLAEAKGFMKPLKGHLNKPSRFDNNLLFNLSVMSFEKMFLALLAYYEVEALNHTPLALFKEAGDIDNGLTGEMKQTAKLIASHESICSLDDKGYTTPTNEELKLIITGLSDILNFIDERIEAKETVE
ncbi:hypothetical protein [uncultured Bacteroides sp.]|uniref:hypothetical protein n=1 Tax=uncultured Bacteroides sp. TaxID=162156 RepID=UPI002AA69747|nr:hypothetical protein [uncultured Bacteroides sp.]